MFANCNKLALAGVAALLLNASTQAAVNLPGDATVDQVDFERHVMGLFGRMGCNMGSCHGSFQGKGGFELSLFGYRPDKDYLAISRQNFGRRINVADPDASLLLLKATGQIRHEGGVRFQRSSWQYQIIRQWIADGALWNPGSGDVESIAVSPPELAFSKAGEAIPMRVLATFSDGDQVDVTAFCDFHSNDDAVADISDLGEVTALQPGSTSIVVKYRSSVLPVNVLVPMETPKNFAYPMIEEVNFIDREVFARLRQLNMVPSELASDEEFLRRLYIDTIGSLPSPEEVREFLADKRKDKRARKIDELLEHPLHAAMWATRFSDITGNDTTQLENPTAFRPKYSQMWHDWLRKRFQENVPYDEIVRGILTASTRDGKSPEQWVKFENKLYDQLQKGFDTDYAKRDSLDLYWRYRARVPIDQWGEKTAAAFMGVRIECAQCHKHPFDRWTQEEYNAYANVFSQVTVGISSDAKKAADAENNKRRKSGKRNNQLALLREIYVNPTGRMMPHPETNEPLPAKALGGPEIPIEKGKDARAALFEWLREPDNPFFAPALVNRLWGHYLGVGIVDPVDDFSLANPPSNPKLLAALAKDFVDSGFDIRHMERQILNSRTYQSSSKTNETNRFDTRDYARAYVRPMIAEAVVDVINSALGVEESWGNDVKKGSKAVEVGSSLVQGQAAFALRVFGRPPRSTSCDCERAAEPALPQKLFMMTDTALLNKLNNRQGRLQQLLGSKKSDDEVLEELFLATLTRFPTAEERRSFREHLQRADDRREALTDTLWALLNTREFILNH